MGGVDHDGTNQVTDAHGARSDAAPRDDAERWPNFKPLVFLGQISYSVFLVHFPVLLIANGLYVRLGFSSVNSAIFGLILALTASIAAATLFYRWIESPTASRSITTALSRVFNLLPRAMAVLFALLVPQRKP